ncbi:hypothetical protein ABPG74_007294 [Tetrahymena malaccensis]
MISQKAKSITVAVLLFTVMVVIMNSLSSQSSQSLRLSSEALQTNQTCYGVIFDAGSSSTKLGVYSWPCRDDVSIPEINPITILSDKISPGLSTFANNLTAIDGYLSGLLLKVKSVVPVELQPTTPIMLGATAGMRLIPIEQQTAILEQTYTFFNNSGFYFEGSKWNRVITGQEEGTFLWIATNYLKGTIKNNTDLQGTNNQTFATIDLGGASTQISFKPAPPEQTDEYDFNVTLPENNDYTLYSISYLGYGNDQARNNVVQLSTNKTDNITFTGCYNNGYQTQLDGMTVEGNSNSEECIQSIKQFLNSTNCTYSSQQCSINSTYQAIIPYNTQIIAVSGVNAAMTSFNLSSPFSPYQLLEEAKKFCSLDFQTVSKLEPTNPYVSTKCFLGLYASTLLIDGYKVGSRLIESPSKIQGAEPTWSLGFLFNEVSNMNCDLSDESCKGLKSIFKAFKL